MVPEFAMDDLTMDRTATLVLAFAVKDLPLGQNSLMMMMMMMMMMISLLVWRLPLWSSGNVTQWARVRSQSGQIPR